MAQLCDTRALRDFDTVSRCDMCSEKQTLGNEHRKGQARCRIGAHILQR